MGRNSFLLYNRYVSYFDMLSDAEIGKIMRAIFAYVCNGEDKPPSSRATKAVYLLIKEQIDFDAEKYAKTIERNRKNGKKHISASELEEKASETVRIYNEICQSLPCAEGLSPEKASAFYKVLGETPQEEFFKSVENSRFLSGKKDNKYTFTLDWLTTPENATKILAGKYA